MSEDRPDSDETADTNEAAYTPAADTIVNRAQTGSSTNTARLNETLQQTSHDTSDNIPANHSQQGTQRELSGQFGRYEIVEELGRGNMGTVYLARDTQLDREVALKVPQFSGDDHEGQVSRFYREARAMATVRHAGLCPVFDVGEIDGIHYLTMAYIDGRPLSDYTKEGKTFPGLQVAALIRKLALALNEAHKNGIVHRDLKPANIMIDKRNEPIIMDFGLARRSSKTEVRLTQTGSILGTPAYMSPEQVDGDLDRIGPASDIYGLGVICYQMLAGRLPFTGSFGTLMVQVMTKAPPPLRDIPGISVDAKLEAICLKAMSKEPNQRQGSAAELAIDLRDYLKEPVETPIPALPPPEKKSKKAAKPSRRKAKPAANPNESVTDQLAADLFTDMEWDLPPRVLPARRHKSSRKRSRNRRRNKIPAGIWIATGVAAAVVLIVAVVISLRTKEGEIRVEINDPDIKVAIKGTEIVLQQADQGTDIKLSPGNHTLVVERGNLKFETDDLTIRKGEKVVLRVELLADRVEVRQGQDLIGKEQLQSGESTPEAVVGKEPEKSERPPNAASPFDSAQAKELQAAWSRYLGIPIEKEVALANGMKLSFMLIPPGEFRMGSTPEQHAEILKLAKTTVQSKDAQLITAESPQHQVTLSQPFYMGKYEVTQGQWKSITGQNPSQYKNRDSNPVEQVGWTDVQSYLSKLNQTTRQTGMMFVLPTEAQWEFACRAGTESLWYCGNDAGRVNEHGWIRFTSSKPTTHPVGLLPPNAFGLHDMYGNVWEWCADWFDGRYYSKSPGRDPRGPDSGRFRAHRGGGMVDPAASCRSAYRYRSPVDTRHGHHGFRLAIAIDVSKLTPNVTAGEPALSNMAKTSPPVKPKAGVLAHYKFDGNTRDSGSSRSSLSVRNTEFRENAIYLNGKYGEADGYRALFQTPTLDYRQYTVALRFKAQEFHEALDRSTLVIGGASYRWFGLRRTRSGNLIFSLNNHSFERELSGIKIQRDRWIVVACGVDLPQSKAAVYFNSKPVATIDLPANFKSKVVEKDADDRFWTFSDYSSGGVFHGLVDEIIVYDRLLSDTEFRGIPLKP